MDKMNNNTNDYHANCAISRPIYFIDEQVVSFNGFSWSPQRGMIHEFINEPKKDWTEWLGTQP